MSRPPKLTKTRKKPRVIVRSKVNLRVGLPRYTSTTKVDLKADVILALMIRYLDKIGCPRYDELELRGFVSRRIFDHIAGKNATSRRKKQTTIAFSHIEDWVVRFYKSKIINLLK